MQLLFVPRVTLKAEQRSATIEEEYQAISVYTAHSLVFVDHL